MWSTCRFSATQTVLTIAVARSRGSERRPYNVRFVSLANRAADGSSLSDLTAARDTRPAADHMGGFETVRSASPAHLFEGY
jgi:hypothetical protein